VPAVKRLILALVALALSATPVVAKGPPVHVRYDADFTFEFAVGEACEDFGVLVETLSGKGHDRIRELDDGTLFIQTTGSWKARITNLEMGESITRNFSGPVNNWFFPDGTGASWNRGHSFAWLTPAEGGPIMWHQRGTIRWTIDENGLFTVVRQTGTSEDLCAALSG
jgi:hypothetical protein